MSAVDGGWAPAVATGCYDGAARLYLPSGKLACKLTAGDGSAPITAVSLLPPEEGASGCVLVAGGHDGVVWIVERLRNVQTDVGAEALRGTRGRRLRRRRRARGRILRLCGPRPNRSRVAPRRGRGGTPDGGWRRETLEIVVQTT